VRLFAQLFVEQTEKNRQQLIDHFTHALKVHCIWLPEEKERAPRRLFALLVARLS
jgi:hypothetical protein